MFSLHLREDICYWKCTCSHQPQALWTILFKNSVVLFNEFRWSYVFDELHYSPISKKVKKKIVIIFYKGYNKAENLQVLITGPAKNKNGHLWKNLRKFTVIQWWDFEDIEVMKSILDIEFMVIQSWESLRKKIGKKEF